MQKVEFIPTSPIEAAEETYNVADLIENATFTYYPKTDELGISGNDIEQERFLEDISELFPSIRLNYPLHIASDVTDFIQEQESEAYEALEEEIEELFELNEPVVKQAHELGADGLAILHDIY